MTSLKHRLAAVIRAATIPFMVAHLAILLLIRLPRFLRAELINIGTGGFGHTLEGPDTLRRLHAGRRVLMVFAWGRGRYNPMVQYLFDDIDVLVLELPCQVSMFGLNLPLGFRPAVDLVLHKALPALLKLLAPGKLLDRFYCEYLPMARRSQVRRSCLDDPAATARMWPEFWVSYYYHLGWLWLRRDIPAPPARLRADWRRRAEDALAAHNRAAGLQFTRRCCIYNRQRGVAGDVHSRIRSGSQIDEYRPAMAWLVQRGYQVLVMGDIALPAEIYRDFGGAVLDDQALGLDRNLFMVFAQTECDAFIGDPAGGSFTAAMAERPMLLLNNFPYYACFPKACCHYKVVRDDQGRPVPPDRLFGEYLLDFTFDGHTISFLDADEILASVRDFIERLEQGRQLGLATDLLAGAYDDLYVTNTEAWLSPVWWETVTGIPAREALTHG